MYLDLCIQVHAASLCSTGVLFCTQIQNNLIIGVVPVEFFFRAFVTFEASLRISVCIDSQNGSIAVVPGIGFGVEGGSWWTVLWGQNGG
jgi:hypothetical protein